MADLDRDDLAAAFRALRAPAPDVGFHLRARNRMLAAAQARRARRPFLAIRLRPLVLATSGVAAAIGVALAGLTTVAAGTLPGDALYAVKTATEQAQLTFTLDPGARTSLRLEFAQRRLDEAERLAHLGRVPEAVQLVDAYTTILAVDATDRELAMQEKVADQQLQALAGSLTAAGQAKAAASVDHARSNFDRAVASRMTEGSPPATVADASRGPGPAGTAGATGTATTKGATRP